jgi:DNA-binding transcriptional LysR family regulator
MTFSLKHARYFVATARSGQVSRAAVELNVSQSAVTAAIHQLESLLGVRLFERLPSGMALTSGGSRFLSHAEHIVAAVDEAARIAGDAPSGPEATVRVGVTYTVAGYFAAPLIGRAQRLLPDIRILLKEAERTAIETDLIAGELDLAIMLTSNLENAGEIEFETLVTSQRRVWAPAEHPLARRRSVSLSEAMKYPYIGLSVDEAMKTQRRYWAKAQVRPNVVFETNSVEAVRTMVGAGMGVTVLSDMVYRPWSLEGQRIETCDLSDAIPTLDVGVAWKAAQRRPPAVVALIEFLKRSATDEMGMRKAARRAEVSASRPSDVPDHSGRAGLGARS